MKVKVEDTVKVCVNVWLKERERDSDRDCGRERKTGRQSEMDKEKRRKRERECVCNWNRTREKEREDVKERLKACTIWLQEMGKCENVSARAKECVLKNGLQERERERERECLGAYQVCGYLTFYEEYKSSVSNSIFMRIRSSNTANDKWILFHVYIYFSGKNFMIFTVWCNQIEPVRKKTFHGPTTYEPHV